MQVIVNGQDCHLAEGSTIAGLLTLLDVDGKLAVEINHSIIPAAILPRIPYTPAMR